MDPDGLKQLHAKLEQYAGWLDRERVSAMVRADVRALGTAIDTRVDPGAVLQALETDIARLPSGDMRKMLRVAAGRLRSALAEP